MSLPTRTGMHVFTVISASAENPLTCSIIRNPDIGTNTQISLTGVFYLAASATVGGIHYRSLCEAMNEKFAAAEGFGTWQINYNANTNAFVFSDTAPEPFSMSVPASSILTQKVFGLASGIHRSSNFNQEISSTVGCWGHWKSSYKERSKWTRPYEPNAFYYDHEADDGTCFSIGRTSTAIYADWAFELEPKRKVFENARTGSDPYTWENVIQDCRADKPWLLFTSSISTPSSNYINQIGGIHRFRAEGSFFKPRFRDANYHNFISVDVKSRVLSGGHI